MMCQRMQGRFIPNDKWARKAKDENFRARSVYKLEELDNRFNLLRHGMKVLDLGAAPGSWLQYVSQKVGPKGMVIGGDLQAIETVSANVKTFVFDVTDEAQTQTMLGEADIAEYDLILSDMAPATSGVKDVDQYRSIELNERVIAIARTHLKRGGACVMKILRGADFDPFLAAVKSEYRIAKTVIVRATRDGSREVFLVAQGKKAGTQSTTLQSTENEM